MEESKERKERKRKKEGNRTVDRDKGRKQNTVLNKRMKIEEN
jgi:hypothetical protein